MRRTLSLLAASLSLGIASSAQAAPYNLTAAKGTTVKYEAKESLTNSTSSNFIVRSLGLQSPPASNNNFGILSDATLTAHNGSGPAFISPDTPGHGIALANNVIMQGGGTRNSSLDLTFNAPAGKTFSAGDLRVNTTMLPANTNLWPAGSYIAWQVSTNGGANFTDIYRRTYDDGFNRVDSGVQTIPVGFGFTSLVIRGIIEATGTTTTQDHWQLIATPPFATGTFTGGLELNLTVMPEPTGMLAAGGLAALGMLRRQRRS